MKNEKIRISLFYNSQSFLIVRILTAGFLLLGLFFGFYNTSLFFFFLLLITEVFVRFKIEDIKPSIPVPQNSNDIYESFTKDALKAVLVKKNNQKLLEFILGLSQNKFFLRKSVIEAKEIPIVEISMEEISKKAFETALKLGGKFVTSTDVLTSYLLLSEPMTKLLFNKKLKEEEILDINSWTRIIFEEESPKEGKARFVGIGIGEELVWGWTPETKKYTKDLTFESIRRRSLIEGREGQYKIMLESMQKPENNNVLLVGEIGTGKNNLVDNFIFESYEEILPKALNHRRFLQLMIGPFIAGISQRGDLETRLQSVIEEIKHSGNVVLYIPEFQNLLGASSFNMDLSGAILPYLKDGKMPIIATMTKDQYKKFFENNAIREVFETITLEEPDKKEALKMLFQKTDEIEEKSQVHLSYKAVVVAINYADKYELGAVLPGTAVDLLTDAANSVKISRGKWAVVLEDDVVKKVEEKSHIPVGAPKAPEKKFLLNLEEEMHKFIIGQDEAIKGIAEAMRRIRSGLTRGKPISFLFLGPTGVGKTETAKTLARLYFGGEAKIIRLDMSEYGIEGGLSRMLSSDSGSFIDEVSTHPFSLILLDEFEKANEKILNLFLQVFDDGRLSDDKGKTVSFNDAIIIATSNAGSELIRESVGKIAIDKSFNKMLLEFLQQKAIFEPELLNRFDEIVVFKPLDQNQITIITKMVLSELVAKMAQQDVKLSFDQKSLEKISKEGYNIELGARPLRRYIQDNIEDMIAKKLLSEEIKRGDSVMVTVDNSSQFVVVKS